MLLEITLLGLVGTWLVAFGRLAATWRDAAPVPLAEVAEVVQLQPRDAGLAA
jgi:hypothetical protein